MKANIGDWLVIKGTTTERSDQRGLVTEVHSADGSPPYVACRRSDQLACVLG